MSPYVYRGKIHDVSAPLADPTEPPAPARVHEDRCGTVRGYKWHHRHGEDPCDPCRDANTEYVREWRAANHPGPTDRAAGTYDPAVCGTHNGYERHRRRNTTPCAECRAGHREYTAGRREARRAA